MENVQPLAVGEVASEELPPAGPVWNGYRLAVIDDAIHPPSLERVPETERAAVSELLMAGEETQVELAAMGVPSSASADERLLALARAPGPTVTTALLADHSSEAVRMLEEHGSYLRLIALLEEKVGSVQQCDPFQALPDLSACDLVLLDYYLEGSSGTGDLAEDVAQRVKAQQGRPHDQQIVLMSSLEAVRKFRTQFREKSGIEGAAFTFVAKKDLDERWKVEAHLGMLARARPYAPALVSYRETLDSSLEKARTDLLALIDDLDIGDYAYLQSQALMKDGHPLGEYVLWLISSQMVSQAFENADMRSRQRELDRLEFVGEPFAPTEPSPVVATFFQSALLAKNVGRLDRHPRAREDGEYAKIPLVQLGDVFFDAGRTRAAVVLSADCDLAFSPVEERAPDADTPVVLVMGETVRLKDGDGSDGPHTAGMIHQGEIYRINWNFSKYRSVRLIELATWLQDQGYSTANRDRLRPLYGLKLQQQFGAHLMRVGPPLTPPMTTKASGRIFVCRPDRSEPEELEHGEVMLSRFGGLTRVRITPKLASAMKTGCEQLVGELEGQAGAMPEGKQQNNLRTKIESHQRTVDSDEFWIALLNGVDLSGPGTVKQVGSSCGFVLGADWADGGKLRVVLEIQETAAPESTTSKEPALGGHDVALQA